MKRDNYIDLGNLFEISKEDFLGAALFQIIKSLGNPFKSILKIGVLEKYLFGKTDSPLLSQKVKMHVLLSRLTNSILDSYLLMFDEVYDYYSQVINDPALLQILKQNLYLKIDPQLSRYLGIKDKKNIPYKVAVMFKYVHDWNWNLKVIEDMDNFDNWDFQRVMHFWDTVKRFMLMSYQKISAQFNTLNLKKQMSESDFILLSRKIKSYFSVEENKFEKLITFKDTPAEPILYIEPINEGIHEVKWRLFKRNAVKKMFLPQQRCALKMTLLNCWYG
jgi:adenylate cyclase class 1